MSKCLIFDMDRTLVDSGENITQSINFTRSKVGLEPLSKDKVELYLNGAKSENLSLQLYNQEEFSEEIKKIFFTHYLEQCTKDLKAYDGIEELIKNLKNKGFILSVASNAPKIFIQKMLEFVNIYEHFDFIAGSDMVKRQKPYSDLVDLIVKNLKLDKKDMILIGDSKQDEMCAKNANIPFIQASWGGFETFDSKYNCSSVQNLEEIIFQII